MKNGIYGHVELDPHRETFARDEILTVLVEDTKIISFGMIGSDNHFCKPIAKILGLDPKTASIGFYLFTDKSHRGHGYAALVKREQIKYLETQGYTYLIGFTSSDKNRDLYIKYGAKIITTTTEQNEAIKNITGAYEKYVYVYEL